MENKITHSLSVIADALDIFGDRIAVASSFGKDSIVTLHLCRRINPNVKVFSVMTPFKFEETFKYKAMLEEEWNLNISTYGETKEPLLTRPNHNQPEECCNKYKVAPTKQAIKELNLSAWICGLRGTEGHTREFLEEIEEKDGLTKVNPILEWTEAEVWLYHAAYRIPIHPLYLQGYRSLGCEPCSNPYSDTERGGRWQGTGKCGGECGIHTQSLKNQE